MNGCTVMLSKSNFNNGHEVGVEGHSQTGFGNARQSDGVECRDPWKDLRRIDCIHEVRSSYVLTMCRSFSPIGKSDLRDFNSAKRYLECHGAKVVAGYCFVSGGDSPLGSTGDRVPIRLRTKLVNISLNGDALQSFLFASDVRENLVRLACTVLHTREAHCVARCTTGT